jgi:catechol-2,3-dioxygenase
MGSQDVERLAAFYRDVLGLAECARHHTDAGTVRSVWLDLGGATLMIEAAEAPARRVEGLGAGLFLLALAVTRGQRAALEEQLAQLGIAVESRTEFTCYFRDPDGNRVALSHYPH